MLKIINVISILAVSILLSACVTTTNKSSKAEYNHAMEMHERIRDRHDRY
jgi:hypothetical protein